MPPQNHGHKKNQEHFSHQKVDIYLSLVTSHQCQQPQLKTAAAAIEVRGGLAPWGAEWYDFPQATAQATSQDTHTFQLID